jgi:hypothetical protein
MTERLRKERMCGMYGPTGEHDSTEAALQACVRAGAACSGGQTGLPAVDIDYRQGVDFDELPEQLAEYVGGLGWVDHAVPGASLLVRVDQFLDTHSLVDTMHAVCTPTQHLAVRAVSGRCLPLTCVWRRQGLVDWPE